MSERPVCDGCEIRHKIGDIAQFLVVAQEKECWPIVETALDRLREILRPEVRRAP